MFFTRIARLIVRVLTTFRRGLLLAIVLLAFACLGWLKHSAAVVQNSSAVIVSAASNEPDALAPDSLATAYGQHLATQSDIAAAPQTQLAGTTVTVAGRPASLLFASPEQINFLIPADLPAAPATVRISAADGAISTSTININMVAPALFTAGGVASGFALRVKADGAQSYESIAEFDTANGQFKPKAMDLNSAAGDQVFLVFFLSGLRRADPAQVRVILGGDEYAPVFAGAVPGAAGLDQINLLLPRELAGKGVLDLLVKAPNARLSNSAKIQIGGGASTLAVSKLSKQTAVAGETLEIEGVNMPTSNVEVLFEPGVGVAPETITPTKMTLRVPYGVASGTVKISVNKQIVYVSPQPMNIITSVSGFVQEFKDNARVAVTGLPVVLTEPGGRRQETVTNNAGAFLIRDATVSSRSTIQIKGQAANGLNYDVPPLSVRVAGNHDNQASREDSPLLVELKPNGSVTTGFAAADMPLNERLQVAAAIPNEAAGVITAGQVTFDTGNSTINCPGGASGCQLALNVFDPGRTPTNLPAGVFSSTIAQITPFGATLTPGGKLTFPNSDAIAAGTPVRVYRFDQTPMSTTFGQFVDIGAGTISSDGQRLETSANAITQASYYFISRQWPTATVIGHVVEADGVRPVRRAVVSARGQSTFTDGNGGFVLRNIPVIKPNSINDSLTLEVSFHRPDGTISRAQRTGIALGAGAQITLPTDIPLPQNSVNSGPAILIPTTLSLIEGETREFKFVVTGLSAGVLPTLIDRPLSASVRGLGNDEFALRLVASGAGNYLVTLEATAQNRTVRQAITVTVMAAANLPLANSDVVTTNEDTPVNLTLTSTNAGSAPVYTVVQQPLHGSLSGTPPNLRYIPATNYNGVDSFGFRVGGGNDPRSVAVVSLVIRPVNDPPVITSTFGAQSISNGQTVKLIVTATDPDGDQLACTALNSATGTTQNLPALSSNSWQFTWTPTLAQFGNFSVTFTVTDGQSPALTALRTITIIVSASKWARTSGPEGGRITELAVAGSQVYAIAKSIRSLAPTGFYISNNGGRSWYRPELSGLLPSTLFTVAGRAYAEATDQNGQSQLYLITNGGQSFVPTTGFSSFDIRSVAVSSSKVFVGVISFSAATPGVAAYTVSSDGLRWTRVASGLAGNVVSGLAVKETIVAGVRQTKVFASVGEYAGAPAKGVFVSSNEGQTWTEINTGITNKNIYRLVASGAQVYAAATPAYGDGSAVTGVFVTSNDGASWSLMNNGLSNSYVYRLEAIGSQVYALTYSGAFVINSGGQSWTSLPNVGFPVDGIETSAVGNGQIFVGLFSGGIAVTGNGGQSWTQSTSGIVGSYITNFIGKGNKIFAGVWFNVLHVSSDGGQSWTKTNLESTGSFLQPLAVKGNKLFTASYASLHVSENDGVTWTRLTNGLPNDSIYSMTVSGDKLLIGTASSGIYQSDNDGQSWRPTDFTSGQIWSLVSTGTKVFAGTRNGEVYRSLNNGANWQKASLGLPNREEDLVLSLATKENRVFACVESRSDSNGIYVTTNDGQSWTKLPVPATSYTESVVVSGQVIYVGTSNNGVLTSEDNGQTWKTLNLGIPANTYSSGTYFRLISALGVIGDSVYAGTDGEGVLRLNNNTQVWNESNTGLSGKFTNTIAVSNGNYYVGTVGNGVFRSTDQGRNWQPLINGLPSQANVQALAAGGNNLLAGLLGGGVYRSVNGGGNWSFSGLANQTVNVLKSSDNGVVFAGTDAGVFRSSDQGVSWQAAGLSNQQVVSLLSLSGRLLAGTFGGGIYSSNGNSANWTLIGSNANGLGNLNVTALTTGTDGTTLFAGTDGGGIYRSTNGGVSWVAVNNKLPLTLNVYSFAVSGPKVYAGSIYGVFFSEDNGASWNQINAGLLDIFVTSLTINQERLLAGTKVGGIFISQIPDQQACVAIAAQPVSKTIASGQTAALSVTPSGNQPFQFQWYQGINGDFSRPIVGARSNTFTTPPLTATTNYWVLVTNGCGSVNSETASVVVNAVPQTDLAITQTISPAQPKPGDNLTFTFTLTNRGSEKALAVNVTNPLPVEVDFTACSATGGGVCGGAGNNRTVFFAEMAGNASATITLTAKVKADAGGKTLRNNAGVSAATNDANLSNNSDPKTVTVQQTSPVIAGLNPTMAIVGGAGFTLAVNGSNFAGGAKVRWNGSERVTSFVSAAQLTAQIPASDLAAVGTAAVTVANPDGQTSNSVAFTITAPQRLNSVLRVVASTGSVGSTVAVPIELVSQGDENALGFSLNFDPTILSNPQPALGSGASGATLNPNLSQAATGRVGLALAMPSGQRFAAGVRQIAVITFTVAANTGAATASLDFGNQPIPREVSDVNANELGATYVGGAVTITRGFEADVAPRPNGNGILSVTDWVLVGRFASGDLAVDAGSEFQRTDCAPRSSFGNGAITVSDWVQAGRYAAGLDPLTPAAGPTAPSAFAPTDLSALLKPSGWPRLLRVGSPTFGAGQSSAVTVELLAQGEENAVSFSLQFDARQWRFASATLGEDAQKAALSINTKFAADGHVGFALALPPGQKLEAGMQSLLTVNFVAAENGGLDAPQPAFSDWPAARELADAKAEVLTADWMPGGLSLFKASPSQDWAAGVVIRVGTDGAQRFEPLAVFDPAQNKFVAVPIEVGDEREQVFLALFGTGWQQGLALAAMEVTVGGVPVEVLYAGEQASGTAQLNLRLPPTLKGRGEVAVRFGYAGRLANPVKAFIK